ncbi:MAG: helix-hairpin-helix domain-containing protein [Bacilli bacterium]|nr:helix-hairpin-helix domain-containing protein [Bacilli bacterium]
MIKLIIGVVIAAVAAITVFMVLDPNISITSNGTTDTAEVSSHTFSTTIEGAVYKPGSYTMKENSTMADLIESAGGISSNADSRAYYEDALITNGVTYYIASKFDASDICGSNEVTKVNINSDTAEVLASIDGISTTIANSIVNHRNSNGLFSTLEQLQDVYGVGNATYKKIRNYVILHV